MDVHGNDNTPEWGWCKHDGCREAALPIWLSGDYPDDPDLLLCPKHIGEHIAHLHEAADLAVRGFRRWKRNQKRDGSRHEAEHGLDDLGQGISDLDGVLFLVYNPTPIGLGAGDQLLGKAEAEMQPERLSEEIEG